MGVLAAQRDRWILWLPVGVILGAGLWLSAPADPPIWLGAAVCIMGAFAACLIMAAPSPEPGGPAGVLRAVGAGACALVASAGLGAGAAELRARSVAQPAFLASEAPLNIEGWVASVDASERGPRLRLIVRDIDTVDAPPRFVRVSVPASGLVSPGRAVRCRAALGPPSGPMAPGGYDFARRAYFERLGATGFGYGRCRPIALPAPDAWLDRARLRVAAMRADLAAEIESAAPGRGGAIAAALVAGDRSGIDPETNETLFNAGLGHLLSVSGVHMAVVGGLVFAMLLRLLSLIPPLALRAPVKKLAAMGALTALLFYLVVSGSSVPALRAFVMASVAFGAILLDRPAISMRGLALAALIVVLVFPESVLEPGFQMSFAATMALVALFEAWKRAPEENALPTPGPLIGALEWCRRGIGGVIGVSLVAGLASDPFALYHFQRFATYALPANLAAAPIMSFLVAPAAAVAAILAPFGLADAPLRVMAAGLELIAAIGDVFGARPEAVRALPRPPEGAFLACVAALLWACLWRGALRWGGAAFLAAAAWLYLQAPKPQLAFDGDLRASFAQVMQEGRVDWRMIAEGGRSSYARERLGAMLGIAPARTERLAAPEGCGGAACAWISPRGRTYIYVAALEGFAHACHADAIVVARPAAPDGFSDTCGLRMLADARDRAAHGGAMVYEDQAGLRVTRARDRAIARPWTPLGEAASDQE